MVRTPPDSGILNRSGASPNRSKVYCAWFQAPIFTRACGTATAAGIGVSWIFRGLQGHIGVQERNPRTIGFKPVVLR